MNAIEIAKEWLFYTTRFGITAEVHQGAITEDQLVKLARTVLAMAEIVDAARAVQHALGARQPINLYERDARNELRSALAVLDQQEEFRVNSEANNDPPPVTLTPEQAAILSRCFRIGFVGALQACVVRGDEDEHLAEMIAAFDAYFAMCRAKLGHDRVPIVAWETYTMIKRRHALVSEALRKDNP